MSKNVNNKTLKELLDDLLIDQISSVPGVAQVKDIKANFKKNTRELTCQIFLTVIFGVKIPDVSWKIQNLAMQILKPIEDIDVKAIDINVIGVEIEGDNNE